MRPAATPLTILANYWFSIVSSIVLAIVAALITERVDRAAAGGVPAGDGGRAGWHLHRGRRPTPCTIRRPSGAACATRSSPSRASSGSSSLLTLPPGAPLRDPLTGDIIGTTPFMDSLLFIISMTFLISGIGYGIGAGTFTSSNDVIAAVTKTFAGLAGLVFMLLMISQFIAYFNYSNLPSVLAIALAEWLETAGIPALPLLIGMIVVILLLDVIMPGLIPKWAIFAPILIPLFIQLGVPPQTGLAAYRVGDSPMNVVTPLMVYLPFMVTIAQRYDKNAGIGTIIALMLPFVVIVAAVWTTLFVVWFLLGLPLGPGYPVTV